MKLISFLLKNMTLNNKRERGKPILVQTLNFFGNILERDLKTCPDVTLGWPSGQTGAKYIIVILLLT